MERGYDLRSGEAERASLWVASWSGCRRKIGHLEGRLGDPLHIEFYMIWRSEGRHLAVSLFAQEGAWTGY